MFIEMESIENGIVELISELGIRKLVMGAAADKHHSKYVTLLINFELNHLLCLILAFNRRMTELKSRKAIFVCREAPALCQILFTCKGYLIHTRFGYF